MFNLKNFKLVKEMKNVKPKNQWLNFSSSKNAQTKDALLDSIIEENQFVEEDMKLRSMVEEMLVKEFSEKIKDMKSYDFLVDKVVNKLKKKQLNSAEPVEEI